MAEHRVVVIGGGIGGLVSALCLSHQGLQVTLLEAAPQLGGKLRRLQVGGLGIDSGPTVMTMRWVFEELFASVGQRLQDHLSLSPLPVLARHFWQDGSQLDLFADPARSLDAVAQFAGPAEARRFAQFCQTARRVYQALEGPFIRSSGPSFARMPAQLGLSGLASLGAIGPMSSLWQSLGRQFRDPRLRQLFARYATYCGSSPWQAPATLMLIAQVEMDGVWSVDGGMHQLAQCLGQLASQQGATLRCNSACAQIELAQGRVSGVRLASGERLAADSVVFNGDIGALRQGLLGDGLRAGAPAKAPARSLSALTWSLRGRPSGLALDRHNVFFCSNYAREFEDIFQHHRLPGEGTVYVCAQDRGLPAQRAATSAPGAAQAPEAERLFCLVNAPAEADHHPLSPEAIDTCEHTSFALLQRCGLAIERQADQTQRTSPSDFHRLFPATGGALYGQATHGWMSAFARPGARSPVPGLFLAGGSVHPGPGLPMAALSGRRAAEALLASPALTKRSHPVATSGGTSTP